MADTTQTENMTPEKIVETPTDEKTTVAPAKTIMFKGRSRLGCTSCKRSKVKCDEGHPSCTRCIKRGVFCSYPFQVSFEKTMAITVDKKEPVSTVSKYGKITELHTVEYNPANSKAFRAQPKIKKSAVKSAVAADGTTTAEETPSAETSTEKETTTSKRSTRSYRKSSKNVVTSDIIRSIISKNQTSKVDKFDDFSKVVKSKGKKKSN